MSVAEIIGLVIAIPTFIVAVIVLVLKSWLEGLVTEPLMSAFGVNPVIIGIVSVVGIFCLILAIIKLAQEAF